MKKISHVYYRMISEKKIEDWIKSKYTKPTTRRAYLGTLRNCLVPVFGSGTHPWCLDESVLRDKISVVQPKFTDGRIRDALNVLNMYLEKKNEVVKALTKEY